MAGEVTRSPVRARIEYLCPTPQRTRQVPEFGRRSCPVDRSGPLRPVGQARRPRPSATPAAPEEGTMSKLLSLHAARCYAQPDPQRASINVNTYGSVRRTALRFERLARTALCEIKVVATPPGESLGSLQPMLGGRQGIEGHPHHLRSRSPQSSTRKTLGRILRAVVAL